MNQPKHDSYITIIEKQTEKVNSAFFQIKEITTKLEQIKDRMEICELTQTDLAKKLDIVEQIIMMPQEQDEQLSLSGIYNKVKDVQNELLTLKQNKKPDENFNQSLAQRSCTIDERNLTKNFQPIKEQPNNDLI